MEIFLYTIIFITGTFFGSFFTLAVYRIPKKEDILIKHSYCPNCNHKLGFFDLFPVLSYVFAGAKCRYCKQKIRPRYLILEILTGLTFLILSIIMKIDITNFNSIINVAFLLIYVSILIIISGIDKEYIKIEKSVLIVGFILQGLYIIYQYIVEKTNVYQYVIYLGLYLILYFILNIKSKYGNKEEYIKTICFLSLYILIYSGLKILAITAGLTLIIAVICNKFLNKETNQMPIGFYLSISNILSIAISNIIVNYI